MNLERDSRETTIRVLWSMNFWATMIVCALGIASGFSIISGVMSGAMFALGLTFILIALYLAGLVLSAAAVRVVRWWQILLLVILPPLCWFGTVKAVDIVPKMRAKAEFASNQDLYERAARWVIQQPETKRLKPKPLETAFVHLDLPVEFQPLESATVRESEGLKWVEFAGPTIPMNESGNFAFCRIVTADDEQRWELDYLAPEWYLSDYFVYD